MSVTGKLKVKPRSEYEYVTRTAETKKIGFKIVQHMKQRNKKMKRHYYKQIEGTATSV